MISGANPTMSICLISRLSLTQEHIKWADILVPVGGDGTFLMTAGRASVFNPKFSKTPVVGFNSDPLRSEGRLMLPKKYSYDPEEAIRRIVEVSQFALQFHLTYLTTIKEICFRVILGGCIDHASESHFSARMGPYRKLLIYMSIVSIVRLNQLMFYRNR